MYKARVPSIGTMDIQRQTALCCGCCPGSCRRVSRGSGL